MDAILSLAVTRLVDRLLEMPARDVPELTGAQARDLAILAACYDQSTAESFPSRWRQLKKRIGYRRPAVFWPFAVGLVSAVVMVVTLVVSGLRGDLSWTSLWWPWIALAAAWLPWCQQRLRSFWRAACIVRSMRTSNRTVGQLARALGRIPEVDLAGQPFPRQPRSD